MIINSAYLINSYTKPSVVDDEDDDTVEMVTRDALPVPHNDDIETMEENDNIPDEENIEDDTLPYEDSDVDSNIEINQENDEINEPLIV